MRHHNLYVDQLPYNGYDNTGESTHPHCENTVVISGALCTVEDYVIMSQCAHNKAIYLAAEGTVSVTDISQTQNITIVGRPDFVNNNFKIALYAKETQRYLCFNDHWKLVGMKELQDTCYFNEAIVHGYFVFRSVVDLHRRIGFTQRGRAVGPKKTVNDACYMFTKIPTDQFFHQHTHFSTLKTKTTTTKIPKTAYTRAPCTLNTGKISRSETGSGNGSGSGSIQTKPNKRFKNHQRQNDTVSHYHSGSGSGSGGGSGNGDVKKKLKRQRNGNKPRRQKQELQQQQFSGHNYNLSNPKNSTYLNSSRKNVILSQNSLYNKDNIYNNNNKNYTNKKQNNNSINNNNNNKHPPQSHQVRHHHNDPNKVARRQQHDQKLKTKQRQHQRPTTSTSYSSSSSPSPVASITVTTTVNSSKSSRSGLSTTQSEIKPTSVTATISTTASANSNTQSSTIVVSKHKSRRRKTNKLQKKLNYSKEQLGKGYETYTSPVEPSYEEDDVFTSSSTDYAWMLSSAKPTSASLPSWETWYPSLSTSLTDKNNGYSSTDMDTASTPTDFYGDTHYSTTTDLDKNTLTLQTSVPLPKSTLTTTLTENGIDATLSPSVTTDLGTTTTTTNTSTYTQTNFWSTSINDNNDLHTDIADTDMQVTKEFQLHSNYATPQLQDVQTYGINTESFSEDTNTSSQSNSKEEPISSTVATTVNSNDPDNEAVDIARTTLHQEADNTTPGPMTTEAKTDNSTIATDLHNCAYSTAAAYNERESTMKITDCIYATKATGYIANYHNFRPQKNEKNLTTSTTTAIAVTTTKTSTKLNTSLPKISKSSQTPSPRLITTLQRSQTHVGIDFELKTATEVATTARTLSLNKSSALTPITTRRTLRKSTQRLLATPFHQLTYVRNEAGDIDIDSIDNISIYPEILDNESVDEPQIKTSTSRLTMISGYLPTSATVTLPESIRIAKIKINRERKRMLRLRNISNYT
ncbi:hypothetical protein DOY81_001965 [Sarcophaga bullata]|nr:hypothetical protein DOY81_001965 [Sarcophaga bullata]